MWLHVQPRTVVSVSYKNTIMQVPKGRHHLNDMQLLSAMTQLTNCSLVAMQQLLTPPYIFMTAASSGAGTTYPSGSPQFTPVFSGVRVTQSLVLCVCFVDRYLSFCTFFWPLCYLFFFDLLILIAPFGICKLFLINKAVVKLTANSFICLVLFNP